MRHLQSNPIPRSNWISRGLTLGALLLLTALPTQVVKAGIRVQARVSTPNLELRVGHPGPRHVVKKRVLYRASASDKRIARRMARMSGVSQGRLMNMHRRGMSWQRIGWQIGLNGRQIKVAVTGNAHRRGHRHSVVRVNTCPWP